MNRPQLLAALDECRRQRAVLVIARLDRLARNLAFIATLMEDCTDFAACDMPTANRLTIHVLAAVAEHEREMISKRTKAALAEAMTCPGFLYQSEFGKARFLYYWSPSHPAGAARREPCSSTAARRLQGRDAVAA